MMIQSIWININTRNKKQDIFDFQVFHSLCISVSPWTEMQTHDVVISSLLHRDIAVVPLKENNGLLFVNCNRSCSIYTSNICYNLFQTITSITRPMMECDCYALLSGNFISKPQLSFSSFQRICCRYVFYKVFFGPGFLQECGHERSKSLWSECKATGCRAKSRGHKEWIINSKD